jgi:dTDP-4-dehydrorhamnose reductase
MVVIFGASGMLGKYVKQELNKNHDIWCVNRDTLDLTDDGVWDWLKFYIKEDDIIVNCAGVIPQKSLDKEQMVKVNTLFPLLLNKLPNKVIHISTDCVFSGREIIKHTESWPCTATTLYGQTKALGEPENKTVIRTSIIGEGGGLLQWLLDADKEMKKDVRGYNHHFWNGITCLQLARIIDRIIYENLFWRDVRHIFSKDIVTKYILLDHIKEIYDLGLDIEYYNPSSDSILPTYRVLYSWEKDVPEFWEIPCIAEQILEQKNWLKT